MDNQVNRNHHRENDIFHGFIPLWALILFSISVMFLMIFIAGLICHLAGFRKTTEEQIKNIYSSTLNHPPSAENNYSETISIQSNQLFKVSRDALF